LIEKWSGQLLAVKYSAKKRRNTTAHIRNPMAGQWKEHFTPRVKDYFERQYRDIIERYGYE